MLRVLVADGRPERLHQVREAVASLGHEVVTLKGELEEAGASVEVK